MDKSTPIEASHNISYFASGLDSRVLKNWLEHTKVILYKSWHSLYTLQYLLRLGRLRYKKSTFTTLACDAVFCSMYSYSISFLFSIVIRC